MKKTLIHNDVHTGRFNLEQKIMEAWHVVDDLKLILNRLDGMNKDQIYSCLHGAEIFANMRFESLWNTFEQSVANGTFNEQNRPNQIVKDMDETSESFGQEKL